MKRREFIMLIVGAATDGRSRRTGSRRGSFGASPYSWRSPRASQDGTASGIPEHPERAGVDRPQPTN